MVYFVGRDVNLYVGTEEAANALLWSGSTTGPNWNTTNNTSVTNYTTFAVPRATGTSSADGKWDFVSGVDLSIGAMDEDITYFGIRSVTKAEIKKETTVSITRKKVDEEWDVLYNDARFGVSGASTAWPGLEEPTVTHGYRVFIQIKSGSEVLSVPNACVQSHSVTVNADGVTEETLEFMSYVTPYIAATCKTGTTNAF